MNTSFGLLTYQSVGGTQLTLAATPATASMLSASLDELVNDIAMRFEIALDLAPWLKAGEDTLRRLDGLIE